MEEGLFGLYSWNGNKPNKRQRQRKEDFLSSDPRYVEKEFNYISELQNGIGNTIIKHLNTYTKKINGKKILYYDIKSFKFQQCKKDTDNTEEDIKDIKIVQDMINKTYFIDDDNNDGTIDWLKLNILRRMKKRGYSEEVARNYVNKYAEKSLEILQKNTDEELNLDNKHIQLIERQSKRKCDQYHKTAPFTEAEFPANEINNHNKKILLEELLIPKDTKQIIISSNNVVNTYKLNPKAIINPWISSLNTGYMSWNMIINKATISCLLNKDHESSKWLFPARLILEKNSNDLFFENCFKELNNKDKTKYLGFFLIRYNLTDELIPYDIEEECKHLYSFAGSKPHKSKEQYYVMFVFKNLETVYEPYKYFIVNFRCNKIPWGDTGELTKILSSEIRQINCMYVNDHFKLYLLLKIKKDTDKDIKKIEDMCKSQYEEEKEIREKRAKERKGIVHGHEVPENIEVDKFKKSYLDCNEAWIHKQTFDLLIENNILPYTEINNTHVLCTQKNINEIFTELQKEKSNIIMQKTENSDIDIIEYIDLNNGYILTECHFIWEADDKTTNESYQSYINEIFYLSTISNSEDYKKDKDKYLRLIEYYNKYLDNQKKNERFLIKHGPLDAAKKKEYKTNFCITSNCIKKLDLVRFNTLQSLYNVEPDKMNIYNDDSILDVNFIDIKKSLQHDATQQQEQQTLQLQTRSTEQRARQQSYAEAVRQRGTQQLQVGGNNDLSKLKFNKYVKKYYKLVDKYNKNNNSNIYTHENLTIYYNIVNTYKPNIKLFYNKDKILINGEDFTQYMNFITSAGRFSLHMIPFIKLNNILIIAQNIAYADKILHIFKNIKVTLLVINNYEIGSFLILKEKYNFVDIYFLGFYFNCLEQIKEICKNNIYDTIIIDPGKETNLQIISIVLGILLCKNYLHKKGTYVHYCVLPDNINYTTNYIYMHNLLYKCFNYHNNNDLDLYYLIESHYPTLLIYNNLIYNINDEEEKMLLDIVNNYYTNYDHINSIIIKTNLDISPEFDSFLLLRWKGIFMRAKEYFKTQKTQDNNEDKKGGYHRIAIKNSTIKIPQTVDDLQNKSKFNGDVKDMAPLCHWGQKKLLLSEIQFFTNICKKLNIKNLKDYIAVYIGSADGAHLPILFNLFPELDWLLYDPNPFNKHVKNNNKVKIFNQYFLDETVQHVLQHSLNKKILFISDIRVTPKDEEVMTDMINQAKWGIELDADFMLLKFRLPYNEPTSFKPKTIKDLKLNLNISNSNFIAKDTIYLKGTINLQLYHPQYSTELRLLVEKKNNKYELDNYDYIEIENKIFNFNTETRLTANVEGYNFLNLIPGYDKSIENIMEYEIVKQYYEYFHNITDYKDIVKKLYDMNFYLEKLTYKKFIHCGLNSIDKSLSKIRKDNDLRITKMKLWREITKMNTLLLSKFQMNYIKKHGKEILGEERYNKALQYLTDNALKDTLLYVKL